MPRAVDVVRQVAPRARPSYVAAFERGDALLRAHGITTPPRLAHFLAQVLHETGGLEIEWENMSYSAERLLEVFGRGCHSAGIARDEAQGLARQPEAIAERVYGLGNPSKARELGNVHAGDGFRYRGGGLMQTTGRANYRRMGEKCGVDFEGEPNLVLSAEHALKPALCEWTEARLNAFADCGDILSISRAINIGNPHARRTPNGMHDRTAWYARLHSLVERVDFAATDDGAAPPTIPIKPAQTSVAGQGIAVMIGDRILRFGDRGSDVEAVQSALARLGYGLTGTGNYGASTRAAVAEFQAKHSLEVDGELGPETAKVIDAALASASAVATPADPNTAPPPPAPPRPEPPAVAPVSPLASSIGDRILCVGDAGDLVRTVQLALAKLGYDLRGSGNFGLNTQSAVADFQAKHGLEVDGEVGPETARVIDAALAWASAVSTTAEGAAVPRPTTAPLPPPAPPLAESPAVAPVSPLASSIGDRILRVGDAGDGVRAVQLALAKLGYDLRGSGNYGPNTRSAVGDFQAKHGLEVNGEVGPETARVIDAAVASASAAVARPIEAPPPPPAPPRPAPPPTEEPAVASISPLGSSIGDRSLRLDDAGDLVLAVQFALAKLGYDLRGSGNYGPDTQSAVADFQAKHGLEVDGEVGPETAKAMDVGLASASAAGRPGDRAASRPAEGEARQRVTSAPSELAALLGDRSLRIGDKGDLVRAFQLALAKLRYNLKGTGVFGGATDTAVTHFQQSRGLEVDGEIGPQTAAMIDTALANGGSKGAPNDSKNTVGTGEGGADAPNQPIWLLEGLKWMDTREAAGAANNPDIMEWARAEGGAIASSYNSDSIPWCALYANMVLTKVGLQGTETLWALDWSNWGKKLAGPAVGAFAPMKREGGGHIAIVIGRDQHGNLMCLGGNQSDAVNIKPFPAQRPVSFRWPKETPPPARVGFDTLPFVASDGRVSAREA
jgi:uncharacterized protein (TIGR02594 family)